MSDRNRHPAASFNLPLETREQLRAIAEYYALGSETAVIRWIAAREARKIQAAERKQPVAKK